MKASSMRIEKPIITFFLSCFVEDSQSYFEDQLIKL